MEDRGAGVQLEGSGRREKGWGGREEGETEPPWPASPSRGGTNAPYKHSFLTSWAPFDSPSLPPCADSGVNFISELSRRPWSGARV